MITEVINSEAKYTVFDTFEYTVSCDVQNKNKKFVFSSLSQTYRLYNQFVLNKLKKMYIQKLQLTQKIIISIISLQHVIYV